jgi:hypothetical protein
MTGGRQVIKACGVGEQEGCHGGNLGARVGSRHGGEKPIIHHGDTHRSRLWNENFTGRVHP